MKEIIIGKNDAGQRIDRFLSKTVPLLPDSLLHKYIRQKKIKCNRKTVKENYHLEEGDILALYINDEFFEAPHEENAWIKVSIPHLDILYEDDNLLLINKKPGVLCHSSGSWEYNTLIANIQAYLAKKGEWNYKEENSFSPALCNRIDRNTGGIVIAAKNAETLRIINEKIRDREIEKIYLCTVIGCPYPRSGRLQNELFKDAVKKQVYVRDKHEPGARLAITDYKVIETVGELSLVECKLGTGRTHQIRVQMAHAGWPLLGDGKYGRERINHKYDESGQALYSWKIRFSFTSDAAILNYMSGKEFSVSRQEIPFIKKYFPEKKRGGAE